MANNLLVLVCTPCHLAVLLGKYYPALGWGHSPETATKRGRRLDAFLTKHSACGDDAPDVDAGMGSTHFAVAYESQGGDWQFDTDLDVDHVDQPL